MITSLEIKGFKCFADLEINPLSRITVLGGKNGVGKTSLLEAVFLFLDRLNPAMILRQFGMRGIQKIPVVPDLDLGSVFYGFDRKKPIVISVTLDKKQHSLILRHGGDQSLTRVQISKPGTTESANQVRTDSEPARVLLTIEYSKGNGRKEKTHLLVSRKKMWLEPTPARPYSLRAIMIPCRGGLPTTDEDCERFGRLDIAGKAKSVVEFLQQFDPRIRDLSAITSGDVPLLYADVGLKRKLPVPMLGDGVSRLLSIYLAIATSPGGVVLVDEIGNGIHYLALRSVWKGIAQACAEYDCQVLATTHSYECLVTCGEALTGPYERDFAYVRLDIENDAVCPRIYDFPTFMAAIKREWEVR